MQINIKIIPHSEQRYPTVGDWWFRESVDGGWILEIRVSDFGSHFEQYLVAAHEADEAMKCLQDGVSEEQISAFDEKFEALRLIEPELIGDMEPGDMISAPYFKQHQMATTFEKIRAAHFNIDWKEYEQRINNL